MLLNFGSALNIPVASTLHAGVKVHACVCVCVWSAMPVWKRSVVAVTLTAGVSRAEAAADAGPHARPGVWLGARGGGGGVEWPFNEKMIRATAEPPETHSGVRPESVERPRVAAPSR